MSVDSGSQSGRMAEVARFLQGQRSNLDATSRLAVQVAHANVEGCVSASLSFVRKRTRIETVASTTPMAADADRLQHEVREGPCLDAIFQEKTVYALDLLTDGRWPVWGPRVVQETDARCVLSLHLFTHEDSLGALNLYSRTADAFNDDALEEALAIAAHTAVAVAAAREIGDLTDGLDSRTVIGQATGILMGRLNLSADVAFKLLARYSSTSNVKLREVAAEVVRTGGLPRASRATRTRTSSELQGDHGGFPTGSQ